MSLSSITVFFLNLFAINSTHCCVLICILSYSSILFILFVVLTSEPFCDHTVIEITHDSENDNA